MDSHHPHDKLKSEWPTAAKDFEGRYAPCKVEADVQGLEILGKVPESINGTFYRVFPDPNQPQTLNTEDGTLFVPLDGDGAISAFRFKDGHVDWKHRYVQTERYKLEKRARRPLFGIYRNPYTNHPCLRAALDSTANTNVLMYGKRLLALKESGQAHELDPHTLETKAYNPFGMKSKTFTAHPKLDMQTGELVGFGYEANGFQTKDICYFVIDQDGNVTKELWFEWPEVAFMHDCILTPNYFILYAWSYEADPGSTERGGHRWAYNPDLPTRWTVIPRNAKDASELRHFTWKAGQPGHIASGWEEKDGRVIHFQCSLTRGKDFAFFPTKGDSKTEEGRPVCHYAKFTIDLDSTSSVLEDPEVLVDMPVEFPRVDDRSVGVGSGKYRYSWICGVRVPGWDGNPPPPNVRVGMNTLVMHDNETGQHQVYWSGWDTHYQEPVFIPRSKDAPEGDGYVMALAKRIDLNLSEIVVLDTKSFTGPPVAVVRLPLALRAGVHGNWVDAEDIPDGEQDLGYVPDVPLIV